MVTYRFGPTSRQGKNVDALEMQFRWTHNKLMNRQQQLAITQERIATMKGAKFKVPEQVKEMQK